MTELQILNYHLPRVDWRVEVITTKVRKPIACRCSVKEHSYKRWRLQEFPNDNLTLGNMLFPHELSWISATIIVKHAYASDQIAAEIRWKLKHWSYLQSRANTMEVLQRSMGRGYRQLCQEEQLRLYCLLCARENLPERGIAESIQWLESDIGRLG